MLIRIDRSVVEAETTSHSWSNETIMALENLALARREGKHSVIADKKTLLKKILGNKSDVILQFWKPKISELLSICDINPRCLEQWKCNSTKICTCKISLGFGENALENSVDCIKNESYDKIGRKIKEPLRSHWEKLGQAIVNWCVADRPIRS